MARSGKKNAKTSRTRSGAVVGAAKPAATKKTPARQPQAAEEEAAALAGAEFLLAERVKTLEAKLQVLAAS